MYTYAQWAKDGTFKAVPGQQIDEAIYEKMLNCMPPKDLPAGKAREVLSDFNIPVHAGFLMGEPYDTRKKKPRYMAFGMNDYGKGKKFFYLGLSTAGTVLHGEYYFFDCMNAFVSDRPFLASSFDSEQEAIGYAADYEATLIWRKYDHGVMTASKVVYDPMYIFNDEEVEA